MRIERACYDCWQEGKDTGAEIENPAWQDVERMILNLDGWHKTLVTFGNYDEGFYMAVGGGKNGKFIAYVSCDDEERIYNLVNKNAVENSMEELVVGGQRGLFPAKSCVAQKMVLAAARYFFEKQEPAPAMDWEE